MLFTGWEPKVEKTTKSRLPPSPPKQSRSLWQLFIAVRLLMEKLETVFPHRNSKASPTSRVETLCAQGNKHRLRLYPRVSSHTNSVRRYCKSVRSCCIPELNASRVQSAPENPRKITCVCLLSAVEWHFSYCFWKNKAALSGAECLTVPVKSLQVFLKDQSQNLSASVPDPPESTLEIAKNLSFPTVMFQ